jgi:type IV fimbrial biogenesis protein FimT
VLDVKEVGLLMRCRGFTLIETMIVVVIIGILITAGMPSLGDFVSNSRLRGVAEQMVDGLNRARMEGIRRNTTINFVPSGTSWTVVLPAGSVVLAKRDALGTEGKISTAITAPVAATQASFNGSGRLTSGSPFTMTITETGGTCITGSTGTVRCLNINVVAGGNIRMCDPAQASTKPEGC